MKSVGGTHRLCCIMKLMKMVQFSSSNLVNSSILGYMRRCICLIVLILVSGGFHAFAGDGLSKEGYMGNVGITLSAQGPGCDVTTSHGYSFGNGLWMGGGAGISFSDYYGCVYLPVFTEVKYTFASEEKVLPFVGCKIGYMTDLDEMFSLIIPSIGVDVNRCSVFVSYNMISNLKTVHFGFAFSF